jgi:dienelactone hydrolase
MRIALILLLVSLCVLTLYSLARRPRAPQPSGPYTPVTLSLDGDLLLPVRAARTVPQVELWYPAAPPARVPLLLYFSSWTGTQVENRILLQDLASRGFAVAAIVYPARTTGLSDSAYREQQAELERPMDLSSEDAFHESLRRGEQRVRERAADATAVLDALQRLDTDAPASPLALHLDLQRAGILGFSLGGAVAAQAAWLDHRFAAAANIDGWHFAEAAEQGVRCPYLLVSDDTPLPTPEDLRSRDPQRRYSSRLVADDYRRSLRNLQRNGGIYLSIAGTRHFDLTDRALDRSLGGFLLRRRTAPRSSLSLLNAYVGAFFEKYLDGEDPPLLNGRVTASFREAKLRIWPRPTMDHPQLQASM